MRRQGGAKPAARGNPRGLAARGLDRVHLVGHSHGRAIATLMALAIPAGLPRDLLAPAASVRKSTRLLRRYAAAIGRRGSAPARRHVGPQSVPADHVVDALYQMRTRPGQRQTAKSLSI